ncbi:GH25 family lysozyme [uncultured Oscillibacter sp.]|uniref:GH25 family lysozyme n=1 Tax=uncultured Oscillibacter sp. TaxID=876091 RepID=UPI002622B98B|nr:GH25 family lysozyme [uncultured Oscillibacter sp.]
MRLIRQRILSGLLAGALLLTPALAFTDTTGHWAESAVNKWSQEYGVLQGYDDGSFKPDASITRGAFAGILDRFLQFQAAAPAGTFSDTKGSRWEDSILKLNAAGVYLGSEGKALPGDSITRQQAMTMVARAFQLGGTDNALAYHDEAQIAGYARPYIAELTGRGWITDAAEGSFRPTEPLTRAELVNLLNNMIQVLIQTSGSYSSNVEGSLLINAAGGAELSNMTVTGDLLIAPGVTGAVTLDNVTVTGEIRNFSSVTPQILSTPAEAPVTPVDPVPPVQPTPPEEPGTPGSGDDFDWGIVVVPTPADPSAPTVPEQPAGPGIQPSEVYTPGITTGETIDYSDRKIPVYAGTEQNQLRHGDFIWAADHPDRLVYIGSQFRTRFGIDVSAYQNRASQNETIDWQAVRNDGVDFAMIRIGLRGYSSGKINEDAFYRQNIEGAMAAGIETGVYFFAQAITVEEAIEEADFVIERLRGLNINGPVAYDWEMHDSSYRVYGTSPEMATACAIAFCKRIQEAGYTPMIYAGTYVSYVKYDQGAIAPYLCWYPEYKSDSSEKLCPTLYYQPDYWQFSSKCSVAGIGGNVDANIQFIR